MAKSKAIEGNAMKMFPWLFAPLPPLILHGPLSAVNEYKNIAEAAWIVASIKSAELRIQQAEGVNKRYNYLLERLGRKQEEVKTK